ncbi:hypothetical protein ACH46N_00080 [Streptomyces pristinaespiralis]|jgi:hypothetical protein|uniref:AG1 protein n=2 Tax=Streptomyces pristinaespiralis TaxID=38300 RepID=B5H681_STRE2|nr:hypothetical protein [Streptomyces pristinaespiralis]ALC20042.1 hypothetical protein SPRI_1736 [Streptomyces pristinaespiralis]EDY62342.1 AG1 protein [Streptomyces pristinaespiralis ATCC 25486]QMU17044.1 hypothetical protein H3L99_28310 [Streptomyces pristinaespiralis]
MAWDEWEQVKAASAASGSATRLNQLAASGSGSGSDLTVHDNVLGKLGDMARSLHGQLATDGDHARVATFEASNDLFNGGLDMGAGLLEVHDAWNTKLRTLREACGHISNHLDHSRSTHAAEEKKIVLGMQDADGRTMTVSRIYDQFT